jgi:hypothetical protein
MVKLKKKSKKKKFFNLKIIKLKKLIFLKKIIIFNKFFLQELLNMHPNHDPQEFFFDFFQHPLTLLYI